MNFLKRTYRYWGSAILIALILLLKFADFHGLTHDLTDLNDNCAVCTLAHSLDGNDDFYQPEPIQVETEVVFIEVKRDNFTPIKVYPTLPSDFILCNKAPPVATFL